jgi:hypothetical protein
MTQIMKLRLLAPDIQEQILFLPGVRGLNERNLRPIVSRIDWHEQRRMFQEIRKASTIFHGGRSERAQPLPPQENPGVGIVWLRKQDSESEPLG